MNERPDLPLLSFSALDLRLYKFAACIGTDPTLFDTTNPDSIAATEALSICSRCVVVAECAATLKPDETDYDGIVAGTVYRRGKPQHPGTRTTLI